MVIDLARVPVLEEAWKLTAEGRRCTAQSFGLRWGGLLRMRVERGSPAGSQRPHTSGGVLMAVAPIRPSWCWPT